MSHERSYAAAVIACLLPLAACSDEAEPRAQWTVEVSTDAQVPLFGNRLLVEIIDGNGELACPQCRRQLAAARPEQWPISFGVVDDGRALRVRARLFRAELIGPDGSPAGANLIDNVVTLPSTGDALQRVSVPLYMACFGLPAQPDQRRSCDPRTGELDGEQTAADVAATPVGSWLPGIAAACPSEPADGMVCVPGGAFLLGATAALPSVSEALQPVPERLVQIRPFALDRQELSVGEVVDILAAHPEIAAEPSQAGNTLGQRHCQYEPGASGEAMPVNCLTRALAAALCEAQDKRLPTEAEWEYAATGPGLSARYPWGDDADVCRLAIVARGDVMADRATICRDSATDFLPTGPVAPGDDPTEADVSSLGIERLGGSLAEWTADNFSPYASGCWDRSERLLDNPICDDVTPLASLRGGSWAAQPISSRVVFRQQLDATSTSDDVGVRCAADL